MKFIHLFASIIFICNLTFGQQLEFKDNKKGEKLHLYTQNSVLKNGTWYKISTKYDGVYKITYNDLVQNGIDVSSINPKNIRIFGNTGGMLPESNSISNIDDLIEAAIYVEGESDGQFDPSDYILFYGESSVKWKYDSLQNFFSHSINLYTDESFYFLTYDIGTGKRIQTQSSLNHNATNVITKFNDYLFHEKDSLNLIASGKEWYGEYFFGESSHNFIFSFPNIDINSKVKLKTNIAARNTIPTEFEIYTSGNTFNITIAEISGQYNSDYAKFSIDTMSFFPTGSNITINVNEKTSSSTAWLNFIDINTTRNLNFTNKQMGFRSTDCIGNGNIAEFRINNCSTSIKIWEITDPFNTKEQSYNILGTEINFKVSTSYLKQFFAFDGTSFFSPTFKGKVPNQNLHSINQTDLIIITHPNFIEQANRLAQIHSTYDNYSIIVTTPDEIYNEFSSGAQDLGAIRNFARMLYDRASTANTAPKYLLLIGDASYDYKDRIPENTNFVPTYESYNSLLPTSSFLTDDFYGILDSLGGNFSNGTLDIGIGRLPVKTNLEAKSIVDKIEKYIKKISIYSDSNGCTTYTNEISGNWRNIACFIADDQDNNLHINQAENIAQFVDTTFKNINIDKIYLDAYVQQTGAGGSLYPDVNNALNNRIQKGSLIINYTGHGGETGWTEEKILQLSDINNWKNICSLPVFMTATCEFSRFDNPLRHSAGEQILLSPNGGGIALFTTTRIAFSNSNFSLNKSLCKFAFETENNTPHRLGDIIRLAKIENGSNANIRNFVLLGDPALKLSIPENTVEITEINSQAINDFNDTLKALREVFFTGTINDTNGQKLTDFNGTLFSTFYDKKKVTTTLANDPQSFPLNFYMQNKILYQGKTTVSNGDFTFSFIIPKDINEGYGIGRMSLYAKDSLNDASGFCENSQLIIGGIDNSAKDTMGPDIKLFLNDTSFRIGGTIDENPLLFVFLSDFSGIQATSYNYGKDITAVLDENTDHTIVLNEYFTPDIDTYKSGIIVYPFKSLSEGQHTLRIKAYDVFNNSSESFTEFKVAKPSDIALKNIYNYPNPFKESTWFYFEHNQPCCDLEVNINIYSISGILIKTINQKGIALENKINPIEWNGCSNSGKRMESGMYIYNIKVKTYNGSYLESSNKLIILK